MSRSFARVPVVREVSFRLGPGEICGYLGANGSGKTTTVRMLVGLLPPSGGDIFFAQKNIGADPRAYRARLGYVPEEAHLYTHLSGIEYLELAAGLRGLTGSAVKKKIGGALEIFGLTDSAESALETYSKGMKQKILLAAAMLHNPDLLILDEPLSGLDVTAVLLVRSIFAALARRGKIILHSSHDLGVVEKVCSRVIVLHKGRVVADDSVAHLGALMKLPNLEAIFSELTHQADPSAAAEDLAALMEQ
ncbi:MAG TPA: ABC transporter ATP-binding protein [Terriglobales bacterium]|nr:ABC transporter ATP-binding protein [Terriglobales bacterium]